MQVSNKSSLHHNWIKLNLLNLFSHHLVLISIECTKALSRYNNVRKMYSAHFFPQNRMFAKYAPLSMKQSPAQSAKNSPLGSARNSPQVSARSSPQGSPQSSPKIPSSSKLTGKSSSTTCPDKDVPSKDSPQIFVNTPDSPFVSARSSPALPVKSSPLHKAKVSPNISANNSPQVSRMIGIVHLF